jgi:cysteinyl-tRNA synthetase
LGYSGIEVRMALLQTHYRVQLNFTLEGLKGASQALKRIDDFVERLTRPILGKEDHALRIKIAREEFAEALSDDLNISEALASLFNLIRDLNTAIDAGDLSQKGADNALVLLKEINQVLGVITFRKEEVIPQELEDAFQKRQAARSAKDYKMADYYRDFITSKGYVIEDAPTGSFIRKLKT